MTTKPSAPNQQPAGKVLSTRQRRRTFTKQAALSAKGQPAPPPALSVQILQVSISRGITFSQPVVSSGGGLNITCQSAAGVTAPNVAPLAASRVLPVSSWTLGLPLAGSVWTSSATQIWLTPALPYNAFAVSSGVVVA